MAVSVLGADRVARTTLRPPSLVGFAQSLEEGPSVLWKAVKSLGPNYIMGLQAVHMESGENRGHSVNRRGAHRAMVCEPVPLGSEL
jgi:hypothetical protein